MKVGWFLFCAWEGQLLKCCYWLPGRQLCPSGPLWLADCKLRQYLKCNPPRTARAQFYNSDLQNVWLCSSFWPLWLPRQFIVCQSCMFSPCSKNVVTNTVSGLLLWTFFLPIHRASFSTTQVQNTHLRCQLVIAYPALCILSCAALRHRPPSALSASSLHLSCSSEKPPSCFLQCHIWQEELYLKVTKTDNFSHSQSSHSTLLCQQQAGRCETAATWRVPAKLKGEAAEWQNCPCPPFFAHVSTVLLPREDWGVEGERALPAGAGLIPAEPLCSSSSSRGKAAPAQLLSFKEGVSS